MRSGRSGSRLRDLRPGERFERLTITGPFIGLPYFHAKTGKTSTLIYYPVRCDCGREKVMPGRDLLSGHSRSCGCLSRELSLKRFTKHGEADGRLHRIWMGFRNRCEKPGNPNYPSYGGRGIKVCEEWQEFIPFREWANANGYAADLTIDRIDGDGPYAPSNCRWATKLEQSGNLSSNFKITAFGETKCSAAWSRDPRCSVSPITLRKRVEVGWPPETAVTAPLRFRFKENPGGRNKRPKLSHWSAEGESKSRLYRIYAGMHQRCRNPNSPGYKDYGGRGVAVCPEWTEYIPFRDWAIANGYDDDLTLDRVDSDGGYRPDNCRWVTLADQARNRRSTFMIEAFGEAKCSADWARDPRCGLTSGDSGKRSRIIRQRIRAGWTPELAVSSAALS